MKQRRPRYTGCLLKRGRIWHLQYTVEGVRYRESAETDNKELAGQKLRDKIASIRAGELPIKDTTIKALAELYLAAMKPRWKPRTYVWAVGLWNNHLSPMFAARKPASILPGDVDALIGKLKEKKLSECYINRAVVIFKAKRVGRRTHR